jgi:hypothetical protein
MKNLFKILLLGLSLAFSVSAAERSNTFFLLPSSIQQQIIIFENKKPIKPRMFYITPDVYGIFHEYFYDTKTEKCWWNKYKLTIHF